jgi:predicted ATPase
MIKKINIENFRSILNASIELEPLSVIVGANATGKSNMIRGIEFLSDLVNFGLVDSLYKRGGYQEVIPKQFNKTFGSEIKINTDITIQTPVNWDLKKLPELQVSYTVGINQSKQKNLKITEERLEFKNCLLNSYFMKNKGEDDEGFKNIKDEDLSRLYNTNITIFRKANKLDFETNFEFTDENLELFANWLGVYNILSRNNDKNKLNKFNVFKLTKYLLNNFGSDNSSSNNKHELILSKNRLIEGFSAHFRRVMMEFISFGKYDLLINELRQEQNISRTKRVDSIGKNVPSVAKRLSQEQDSDLWDRILTTMCNISPYFESVESKSLRAGKEYLEFTEVFGGKGIESWESSDGTLRAFATLLAVETHPAGSTLMIEEPEHGLHPWAIKDLIAHIRDTIENRRIQVIITTHSQQVLECLKQEELLIAERTQEGTKFYSIEDVIPEPDITMGEIGDLWVRGLLKGVPVNF